MESETRSETPVWWTDEHSKSWERARGALRRSWSASEPWDEVEPALRYGHGAALHYVDREWDAKLVQQLKQQWHPSSEESAWERVKASVRRGWESAKLALASTQIPLL